MMGDIFANPIVTIPSDVKPPGGERQMPAFGAIWWQTNITGNASASKRSLSHFSADRCWNSHWKRRRWKAKKSLRKKGLPPIKANLRNIIYQIMVECYDFSRLPMVIKNHPSTYRVLCFLLYLFLQMEGSPFWSCGVLCKGTLQSHSNAELFSHYNFVREIQMETRNTALQQTVLSIAEPSLLQLRSPDH